VTTDNTSVEIVNAFIKELSNEIVSRNLPIGHLKFFLSFNEKALKLSFTTFLDDNTIDPISLEKSNSVDLLINARIQTSPEELRNILFDVLDRFKSRIGLTINEKFLSYFQPGFPNPTHRFA